MTLKLDARNFYPITEWQQEVKDVIVSGIQALPRVSLRWNSSLPTLIGRVALFTLGFLLMAAVAIRIFDLVRKRFMTAPAEAFITPGAPDKLVEDFWLFYGENINFRRIATNSFMTSREISREQAAKLLVMEYERLKPISLKNEEKNSLLRFIQETMKASKCPIVKELFPFLPNGFQVRICRTAGEGSCGVHALLGRPDDEGKYYYEEVAKFREEFAAHILNEFDKGRKPQRFVHILEEYYDPKKMGKSPQLKGLIELHQKHDSSTSFANDRAVWKIYSAALKDTTFYLEQQELFEMAAYAFKDKGQKLILVQNVEGKNCQELTLSDGNFNDAVPAGTNDVYVFYYKPHFERIEVTKFREILKTKDGS